MDLYGGVEEDVGMDASLGVGPVEEVDGPEEGEPELVVPRHRLLQLQLRQLRQSQHPCTPSPSSPILPSERREEKRRSRVRQGGTGIGDVLERGEAFFDLDADISRGEDLPCHQVPQSKDENEIEQGSLLRMGPTEQWSAG